MRNSNSFQTKRPPANTAAIEPDTDPPQKEEFTCTKCLGTTFTMAITATLSLGMLACTVAFAVVLSSKNADVSSDMLVFTGRRTRDWTTANTYSMNSAGDDRFTRLYVCMKSAGVVVPGFTGDSFAAYRIAAKQRYDCGLESDFGWPRDVGFMRCIQKNFAVDFHRSNVFMKCLDLTEGIMAENVQTEASTLFLGSYNFVTFLLLAMGIIAAFLIFTAGGWFSGNSIQSDVMRVQDADRDGPIFVDSRGNVVNGGSEGAIPKMVNMPSGYTYISSSFWWAPLAAVPTGLALAWSVVMFIVSMYYTYPAKGWSDVISVDNGATTLPATPWTGYMCSGMSFLMSLYFLSCLFEWAGDYSAGGDVNKRKQEDERRFGQQSVNAAKAAAQAAREEKAAGNSVVVATVPRPEAGPIFQPSIEMLPIPRAADFQSFTNRTQWDVVPEQWGGDIPKTLPLPPPPMPPPTIIPGGSMMRPQLLNPDVVFPPARAPPRLPSSVGGGGRGFNRGGVTKDPNMYGALEVMDRFRNNQHNGPTTRLGYRFNNELHYTKNAGDMSLKMAPPLNKVFALSLVFVDGPLFLGMLNGMNSPLNENVVAIWYYIVVCRGFQLAAAYFMDDVLFYEHFISEFRKSVGVGIKFPGSLGVTFGNVKLNKNDMRDWDFKTFGNTSANDVLNREGWNNEQWNDSQSKAKYNEQMSKITHAAIAVISSHLASLICLITVMYHFINALSIPSSLSDQGINNPVKALQIAFLVIVALVDVFKHIIALLTVLGRIDQHQYLNVILSTYSFDWVFRAVFITAALFVIPDYLGGLNRDLIAYLAV